MISPRMLPCLVFAVAGSAAVAGAAGAQAQRGDEVVVPLTDPSRPAVLLVGAFSGNIVVRGTNPGMSWCEAPAPTAGAACGDGSPPRRLRACAG